MLLSVLITSLKVKYKVKFEIKWLGESHNNQVLKEAQALASLSALDENPFIVRYYNTWVEDGKLYLVVIIVKNTKTYFCVRWNIVRVIWGN